MNAANERSRGQENVKPGRESSLLHHFLILRSDARRVSKDEAKVGASWFSRRCEASSGDGALFGAPFATASLSLGLLGCARLLTMRIWRRPYSTLPIFFTAAIRR